MYRHIRRFNSRGPILALVIACLAFVSGPGTAMGSDQQEEKQGRGGGFDFFVTDGKRTTFEFKGASALPAGFFDKDSARFEGPVSLQGSPIRTFRGHAVGNTDTIVQRKSMPKLGPPYPSRGTAELEVVALSLDSVRPLQVKAGGKIQLWDVKLRLSPNRPSSGKATIVQRSERGGVFSSELTILGLVKFIRRGDGAERELDLGTRELEPSQLQAFTLHATNVPWERKAPKGVLVVQDLSDDFYAGVLNGKPTFNLDKGPPAGLCIRHWVRLTPIH